MLKDCRKSEIEIHCVKHQIWDYSNKVPTSIDINRSKGLSISSKVHMLQGKLVLVLWCLTPHTIMYKIISFNRPWHLQIQIMLYVSLCLCLCVHVCVCVCGVGEGGMGGVNVYTHIINFFTWRIVLLYGNISSNIYNISS